MSEIWKATVSGKKGYLAFYNGIGAYVGLCCKPAIQFTVFEQVKKALLRRSGRPLTAALGAFEVRRHCLEHRRESLCWLVGV